MQSDPVDPDGSRWLRYIWITSLPHVILSMIQMIQINRGYLWGESKRAQGVWAQRTQDTTLTVTLGLLSGSSGSLDHAGGATCGGTMIQMGAMIQMINWITAQIGADNEMILLPGAPHRPEPRELT